MFGKHKKILAGTFVRQMVLSLLSAFLLFLASPGYGEFPILVWVALVPLFFALAQPSLRRAVFVGFMFGFAYYGSGMISAIQIQPFFWVWVVVSLFGALMHFPLVAVCIALFYRMNPRYHPFSFVFIWVLLDWLIREHIFAFPVLNIAETQYAQATILQSLNIFGVYGIALLLLLTNACVFVFVLNHFNLQNIKHISEKGLIIFTTFFLLFVVMYSTVDRGEKRSQNSFTGSLSVLLVQPSFLKYSDFFSDPDNRFTIFESLTREAVLETDISFDLIVWPETAFTIPLYTESLNRDTLVPFNIPIHERIVSLQSSLGIPMLFGTYITAPAQVNPDHSYNSMVLVNKEGLQWYNKQRPLFFGEYLPSFFGPIRTLSQEFGFAYRIPGKSSSVFSNDDFSFSTLICSENGMGDLARNQVLEGAQFLINPSNSAVFKNEHVLHQTAILNTLRAIEHNIYVLEIGNVGETGIISNTGEVLDSLPLFEEGYLAVTVPLKNVSSKTLYSTYGNWPVLGGAFLGLLFLGVMRLRKHNKR